MKKILTVLVTAIITSIVAVGVAQAHCGTCPLSKKKDGDYLETKMAKMTEKLGLSAEQATKVKALMKEKMDKKMAIKEEKRTAIDAVKEKYSAKIKEVLTDEQKVKYDEMVAEYKKDKKCEKCADCDKKGSGHDHKGSGHDHKGSGADAAEKKGS